MAADGRIGRRRNAPILMLTDGTIAVRPVAAAGLSALPAQRYWRER
jgi:hypothetical protein